MPLQCITGVQLGQMNCCYLQSLPTDTSKPDKQYHLYDTVLQIPRGRTNDSHATVRAAQMTRMLSIDIDISKKKLLLRFEFKKTTCLNLINRITRVMPLIPFVRTDWYSHSGVYGSGNIYSTINIYFFLDYTRGLLKQFSIQVLVSQYFLIKF